MKAVVVGAIALIAAGVAVAVGTVRARPMPEAMEVLGYTGRLGEWELKANLQRAGDELSGPMSMRHVGICTVEGPEEKSGHMRVRLSRWSSSVEARLTIDGVECLYDGPLSESHETELSCPDRRPSPITLWAKD